VLTGTNRGSKRLTAFVVAVASSALLCALWAGVASAAKPAAGTFTLEICKDGSNGATGTTFNFTVTGVTGEVAVVGGTCQSLNASIPNKGTLTIQEDSSNPSGWVVQSITATDQSGADVSNGTATLKSGKVTITPVADSDVTVTYVNAQAASTLKICKWSSAAALQNQQYSFTVGNQTVTAVSGSSPGTGTCSALISEQIGSKVKITEQVPPKETVASIAYSPSSIGSTASGASTTVKIAAGLNIVTYEDEPVGPPQTGFIEICKDAYDSYVNGTFHFEITDTSGNNLDVHGSGKNATTGEDVLVGQCSGPIQVPAGTVVVTESPNSQTLLQSVWANPAGDLGLVNPTNQTANVVVPVAADSTGEVQVHFVNQTQTSTLKICKYLAGGNDLAGDTFNYTVTDDQIVDDWGNPIPLNVSLVAAAGSNGACKIVADRHGNPILFPIGSKVSAVEDLSWWNYVSGDGGAPGANDKQSTPSGQITGGINTISFTNAALGQLEICKDLADGSAPLVPFTIKYQENVSKQTSGPGWSSSGSVTVDAGTCSMPQIVPVGNYTITETLPTVSLSKYGPTVPAYQVAATDARGPLGDNRCVPTQSGPRNASSNEVAVTAQYDAGMGNYTNCTAAGGNSLVVSVPYFGGTLPNGGETDVEIWNVLVRAQLKICKQITGDSTAALNSLTFTYSYTISSDGSGTASVKAGTCSGLIVGSEPDDTTYGGFPIVTSTDGHGHLTPTEVDVTETGDLGNSTITCGPNNAPTTMAAYHVNQVTLTGGVPSGSYSNNFGSGHGTNGLNGKIPYEVSFNAGPGPNVVTFWNQSNQCDTSAG
jgi:hypothetical protein